MNQYQLQVRVKLRPMDEVVHYDGIEGPPEMSILQSAIVADYIFISDMEKAALSAKKRHEFVMEQWNANTTMSIPAQSMSMPVHVDSRNVIKEIYWAVSEVDSQQNNDLFNYSLREIGLQGSSLITQATLLLDNQIRIARLPESYFRLVTTHEYHHRDGNNTSDRNIYCISFASSPELLQPSGLLDGSRYDQIVLQLDFVPSLPPSMVYVLVVTYNVLVLEDNNLTIRFV
jgi:hypothetical protein